MSETRYSLVNINYRGHISAEHVRTANSSGSTSGIWKEEEAYERLAEGGFVIDKRPLANHPQLTSWVWDAPLCNGRIADEEVDRLDDGTRQSAADMAPWMAGEFRTMGMVMALGLDKKANNEPSGFDKVSAEYLALHYWHLKGARVGKKVGGKIEWFPMVVQIDEEKIVEDEAKIVTEPAPEPPLALPASESN